MPRSTEITLTCVCGNQFTAIRYHTVNVTLEPHLLYRLLAGTLNVAVCPNCGRRAESAHPFIYHDMKRSLFAYVYADETLSEDERDLLLQQLRTAYVQAVEESERITQRNQRSQEIPRPTVRRSRPYDDIRAAIEPDSPPMQVIFGTGNLVTLVDSLLEPEEKLGKIALNYAHHDPAESERILAIAQQLASQTGCEAMLEDSDDLRVVYIFGPRGRINALAKALHTPA